MKTLLYSDDRAGKLLWNIFTPVLVYSAQLLGEIADTIVDIDRAMKWGFGWEQGPFEIWDAIGLERSLPKMTESNLEIPQWIKDMIGNGHSLSIKKKMVKPFIMTMASIRRLEENPKILHLAKIKKQKGIIKKNNGASLIDIGDGVALLEFHSPNNAIGLDILQMINSAIDEVDRNYKGLVIGNQGKNFCVGANLFMMLMEAQDDEYL